MVSFYGSIPFLVLELERELLDFGKGEFTTRFTGDKHQLMLIISLQ